MNPERHRYCINCGQELFLEQWQWYGFCDDECERQHERKSIPMPEDDIEFAQALDDGSSLITREDSDDY